MLKKEKSFGLNEPYIDVGIIYHQGAGLCLLLKPCFNIKNDKTANKISVCCGVLSYKLKSKTSDFIGGEYYTKKKNLVYLVKVPFLLILAEKKIL
jgi:hypothetical protein